MSGGITQLVAIGAQDAHLVGDPEVSYFRGVYSRHTNFAHSVEKQVIQGNVSNDGMSSVRFERKGDLLSYVYLTKNDVITDWTSQIKSVELLIGGQVVDVQDSVFSEKVAVDAFAQNMSKSALGVRDGVNNNVSYFYPLRFFFCENWQAALPLVALQYHDVEIRINWASSAAWGDWECFANYIFLDADERKEISEHPHDMLITQVQRMPASNSKMMELNFNHPVKFIACPDDNDDDDDLNNLAIDDNRVKMQFNGVDVGDFRNAKVNFVDAQAFYHTNFASEMDMFLYNFGLNTSGYQPSGTLNFSRLDSARIISEKYNINKAVYAVNYNILRIENGMAGVMYAN